MITRSRMIAAAGASCLVAALLVGLSPGGAAAAGSDISGHVYSHTSAGLAGATVTAYAPLGHLAPSGDAAGWTAVATTVSGTGGAYDLAGLTGTAYRIKVQPANLATDSYGYYVDSTSVTPWVTLASTVAPPASGVDVQLTTPATISGTITDVKTLKGIAGVQVRALSASVYADTGELGSGPGGPSYSTDYLATLTDRKGHYVLTGLPSSAPSADQTVYGIVAVDPSGQHACWYWWFTYVGGFNVTPEVVVTPTSLTAQRNLQLLPSGVMKVHVTDAAGRPVAGLSVQPDSAFVYPTQYTDARGNVLIGGMSQGGNPVTAFVTDPNGPAHPELAYRTTWFGQAPSYATSTKVLVPSGRTVTLNITVLRDAAAITGTTDPGTWMNVYRTSQQPPPDNGDLQWKLSVGGANALSDGFFMATGLWPGDALTATFYPGNSAPLSIDVAALDPNEVRDLGTVTFP